jgi:hypothetical protein
MTWGAYGAQHPSETSNQWRDVTVRDNGHFHETPGQGQKSPTHDRRPQQDSNLRSRLRRPLLSPLSYGGSAPGKGYQPQASHEHVVGRADGLQGSSRYNWTGRYPHALDILPSWGGDSNLILTLLVGVQIEVRGSQAG